MTSIKTLTGIDMSDALRKAGRWLRLGYVITGHRYHADGAVTLTLSTSKQHRWRKKQ